MGCIGDVVHLMSYERVPARLQDNSSFQLHQTALADAVFLVHGFGPEHFRLGHEIQFRGGGGVGSVLYVLSVHAHVQSVVLDNAMHGLPHWGLKVRACMNGINGWHHYHGQYGA